MSSEFRIVPEIPFQGLGSVLEKYGIGSSGLALFGVTLTGSNGTVIARRGDDGCAEISNACGYIGDIFDAIEDAFGASVLDEQDWQEFCQFHSGLTPADRPGSLLIEGPPIDDARSVCAWAQRAQEVDDAMQANFESSSAGDGEAFLPQRLLSSCAMYLMPRWFEREGVFHVNTRYSRYAAAINIMIAVGFLQKVGVRYRMAVPENADPHSVSKSVFEILKQRGVIRPVLMFREDAEALARSIRAVPRQAHISLRGLPAVVATNSQIQPTGVLTEARHQVKDDYK